MRALQLMLAIGIAVSVVHAQAIPEWTGGTHAYLSTSTAHTGKASVCIPAGISRLSQDINPADIAGHRIQFVWFDTTTNADALVRISVRTPRGTTVSQSTQSSGSWQRRIAFLDIESDAIGITIELDAISPRTPAGPSRACFDDLTMTVVAADYEEPCQGGAVCVKVHGLYGGSPPPAPSQSEVRDLGFRYARAPRQIRNGDFETTPLPEPGPVAAPASP